MTELKQSIKLLVGPVVEWLRDGGDAWAMNLGYWDTRQKLMDMGETFGGPGAEFLSNVDTAMDSFSPDADRGPYQIDEAQLRLELDKAIGGLQALGYLAEE